MNIINRILVNTGTNSSGTVKQAQSIGLEGQSPVLTVSGGNIRNNGYLGLGVDPVVDFQIKSNTAIYSRLEGAGDGDNYAGTEFWSNETTPHKWQIMHRQNGTEKNNLSFINYNSTIGWTFPLTIKENGNVGIGTTSPNKLLHLKTPTGTNAELDIQSGTKPHWGIYHDESTEQLRFWNGSDKITFSSGGNVGIGTNLPGAYTLFLNDSYQNTLALNSDTIPVQRFMVGRKNIWGLLANYGAYGSGFTVYNYNNDSIAMHFNSGGNIGIGTYTPGAKLDVNGNIIISGNNSCTTRKDCDLVIGNAEINRHDSGLSIMSSTSAIKMKLTGNTLNIRNWDGHDNTILDTYNFSARLYSNVSDLRLKKDISSINSGISTINNLRGVTYHWKDNAKDKDLQYGFIAQEVEKVLPDLVKTDDKGYKSVNYIGVIPVLVKSVQELSGENKDLKSLISNLKSQNSEILNEIKSIKEKLNQ